MSDTPPHFAAFSTPQAAPPPPSGNRWAEDRGRVLGIVGFACSFVFLFNVAGLVLCIIALVRSRRAGFSNGFALAGAIIAPVTILFCAGILLLIVPPLIHAAQMCAQLGYGVHVVGTATYTCTPSSISVTSSGW